MAEAREVVLNAFRHHRLIYSAVILQNDLGRKCSTPFGIID